MRSAGSNQQHLLQLRLVLSKVGAHAQQHSWMRVQRCRLASEVPQCNMCVAGSCSVFVCDLWRVRFDLSRVLLSRASSCNGGSSLQQLKGVPLLTLLLRLLLIPAGVGACATISHQR
jgi:hypothetical protein